MKKLIGRLTSVKFILVIYIITAFCVLLAVNCYRAFKIGPFSQQYEISDMSGYFCAGDARSYFIENSGRTVTAVNEKGEYIFSIDGGNRNDGFFHAREIACDDDGNMYLLDKVINTNGKDVDSERILKYDGNGKLLGCLLEETELSGENLMGLAFLNDALYAALISDNDIQILRMTSDGEPKVQKQYSWDNASMTIQDIAISRTLDGVAVTKSGNVVRLSDGTVIFDAAAHNSSEYYAMALEAAFDTDGTLYISDIGNRVVMRYDGQELTEFIARGEPLKGLPDAFSELSIYTGLNCKNGTVSVTYAENYYDKDSGEVINHYNAYVVSAVSKTLLFNSNTVRKSAWVFAKGIVFCVTAGFLVVAILYTLLLAVLLLRQNRGDRTFLTQLGLLAIAIVTAGIVAGITLNTTNQRYFNEVMNKMTNISLLMANSIDEDDVNALESPESFMSQSYNHIDRQIKSVLQNEINAEDGIYCIIYRVHNGIVYEAYSDETLYGTGYPMPGGFEGSAEQEIYETGQYMSFGNYNGSDGSYMFVLMPIKNAAGEVTALMEVGTDLYIFTAESNRLFFNILLYAAMTVIILLLLAGEVMIYLQLRKDNSHTGNSCTRKNAGLIRPVSFLLFFAANMSTAFLPVYGESLWHEGSLIPKEMASALPLSAELLFAALTAFAGGFIVNRVSARNLCIFGALMYVAGNALCGTAPTLGILILGNSVCGIGGGCFATSINSYVAEYAEEKQRNSGFAGYNASYLAGMNCGTVVGSAISERFGVREAFLGASIVALASVFFIVKHMDKRIVATERLEKSTSKHSVREMLTFLFRPGILRYFFLLLIPYLVCTSFLSYFFPLFGEENSLTSTQISSAFLVSGVISIYLGPIITDIMIDKCGAKLSAVIASFIYVFSFLLFTLHQNIAVCFVIVGLLAIADSFGLTAQSVEYSSLDEVTEMGEGKAMGISSAFENSAYTLGPVLFSGLFMLIGYAGGIGLIGIIMLALLLLYVFAEFRRFRGKRVSS